MGERASVSFPLDLFISPPPVSLTHHALTWVIWLGLVRQAKVAELAPEVAGEQHVPRRHIAVHKSHRVHMRQPGCTVTSPLHALVLGGGVGSQVQLEAAVLHVLKHEAHGPAGGDDANEFHHVRVGQLCHDHRLVKQFLACSCGASSVQSLDSDNVRWNTRVLLQHSFATGTSHSTATPAALVVGARVAQQRECCAVDFTWDERAMRQLTTKALDHLAPVLPGCCCCSFC